MDLINLIKVVYILYKWILISNDDNNNINSILKSVHEIIWYEAKVSEMILEETKEWNEKRVSEIFEKEEAHQIYLYTCYN